MEAVLGFLRFLGSFFLFLFRLALSYRIVVFPIVAMLITAAFMIVLTKSKGGSAGAGIAAAVLVFFAILLGT